MTTTPAETEHSTAHLLVQVGRLADASKSEFDLIGARIGWLMTSEAFIFAAFATCVANYRPHGQLLPVALTYLICALPILGIALALLIYAAVHAAHKAAERLKEQRDLFMTKLPDYLQVRLVSSRDVEHKLGNVPSQWVPWLFVVVWIGALLSLPRLPWW